MDSKVVIDPDCGADPILMAAGFSPVRFREILLLIQNPTMGSYLIAAQWAGVGRHPVWRKGAPQVLEIS